jgi:hypothetical protein
MASERTYVPGPLACATPRPAVRPSVDSVRPTACLARRSRRVARTRSHVPAYANHAKYSTVRHGRHLYIGAAAQGHAARLLQTDTTVLGLACAARIGNACVRPTRPSDLSLLSPACLLASQEPAPPPPPRMRKARRARLACGWLRACGAAPTTSTAAVGRPRRRGSRPSVAW